jgi:hypothetical protein
MTELMKLERYSPPDFCANCYLSIIDNDPRTLREALNSKDSKIWKKVMDEDKKVLLEKVNTLKNDADSLTKSMSTKKFSWCRETMGIIALNCCLCNHVTPICKENNKWENVR